MGGVKVDGAKGGGSVGADGAHEVECRLDRVDDALVGGFCGGVGDVREGPFEGEVEVCEAGGKLGAEVVEGCGRVEVGAVFGISKIPHHHLLLLMR